MKKHRLNAESSSDDGSSDEDMEKGESASEYEMNKEDTENDIFKTPTNKNDENRTDS